MALNIVSTPGKSGSARLPRGMNVARVAVLFILQVRRRLVKVWDFSTSKAFVLRHECASILSSSFECMDVKFIYINGKSILAIQKRYTSATKYTR